MDPLTRWSLGLAWAAVALLCFRRAARRGPWWLAGGLAAVGLTGAATARLHVELLYAARRGLRAAQVYESRVAFKAALALGLAAGTWLAARTLGRSFRRLRGREQLALAAVFGWALFLAALTTFLDDVLPRSLTAPPGRALLEAAAVGVSLLGLVATREAPPAPEARAGRAAGER